ncbi:large conductance mechanosensitive channel protein MscL [Pseudactinotalea sp. Z1739]|uniref:large conductance mechanosensitive channel protein MscL n=1 Tax=Pseudactinotalea sp. Z1739 TaxID=3413028 RepID=UPI003C7ACBC3
MFQGFKDFIARGNAIDLAVGVVVGAAFTLVVTNVVDNVLNPLIAGLVGEPNFDTVLSFHIGDALVMPGTVITALINFLLVALALYFVVVTPMNKFNERRQAGAEEEVEEQILLLREIRDSLAAQSTPGAAGAGAPGPRDPGGPTGPTV